MGKQIIYLLATKPTPSLEGPEWERIFAEAIDGEWKPTNVGLDDIVKGVCAWGAKSVMAGHPFTANSVRLISGRNNPEFSFGSIASTDDGIGKQVLDIWNARVDEIRSKYAHARTVVLLKGTDWSEFSVFEVDTVRYPPDLYVWRRNKNNNLEAYSRQTSIHCFTWQRHGSQFTIVEPVPKDRLMFRLKKPDAPAVVDELLEALGYDDSWIEVVT